MGERRGAYRILVGKSEGKIPFGRPWLRWDDNILISRKSDGVDMNWIDLAENRDEWRAVANAVMKLRVP
jgi:1-acyl-sn-glycerol-3-phosphate acyltransferase